MNKKIISIGVILFAIILSAIAWNFLRSDESLQTSTTNEINQTEVEVISVEKPASFDGVEMVTYKSPFFELTFPKKWKKNEGFRSTEDESFYYSVTPDILPSLRIPGGLINPLLSIDVKNAKWDSFHPDPVLREKWIVINNKKGIYSPGLEGTKAYYFLENGKTYSIQVIDVLSHYNNISEQEAFWVLSTFKITE